MGLLVLKVFTIEFYRIALVFFIFGTCMVILAHIRSQNSLNIYDHNVPFKTNGNVIIISFIVSLSTFMILFLLLFRLDQ